MNPEIMGFVKDFLWAPMLALFAWAFNHHTKRVDELRVYVDDKDASITKEVNRQRDVSAKIFEKLEEHARRSEDRHVEIITALHVGLSKKADRRHSE